MKPKRLFFAFPLPSDLAHDLFVLANTFQLNAFRPTRKENLHITLLFLGKVFEEQLVRIKEQAREVLDQRKAFSLSSEKLIGTSHPRSRMVWLELADSFEFNALRANLIQSLARAIDVSKENRPHIPHITLGRIRDRQEVITKLPEQGFTIKITEVVLFESIFGPGGVRYERRETYPLL